MDDVIRKLFDKIVGSFYNVHGLAKQLADKDIRNNIILTDDVQLSLNPVKTGKNLNVCVIGGSGTGKTRNYVLPNILQANTSYVITDHGGYLLNKTRKFLEEQGYVIKVLNLNDTENDLIGDRKTAVFIPLSASNPALMPCGTLVEQIFNALCNRAYSLPNHKLPVHVRFMLDEFANCGYIPDFEKYIAVCGNFNMSMNITSQSVEQLQTLYKYWDIMLGNCDSTLFLGNSSSETLKFISEIANSQVSVDELKAIGADKCILNIRRLPIFSGNKFDVEKHINYGKIEN